MPRPADRLVLGYHGVSETAGTLLSVRAHDLERQLWHVLVRGYRAVTLGHTGAAERTVAVTFDDAERNVRELALPVLAELRIPATVFVPVAWVGERAMSWTELAELAAAGWEIGSHSLTHARLPGLDDAALERELRESRERIEDALGVPCRSLAYPFGAVDERVRATAARTGYRVGCTTDCGLRERDPLLVPRVGVDGRDGMLAFRLKTSWAGRVLRGSALGPPSAAVIRAVGRRTSPRPG